MNMNDLFSMDALCVYAGLGANGEQEQESTNKKFNNNDLIFDIEMIKSFDAPITLAKSYDSNLYHPFALDVEDTSYWYAEQKERDEDFNKLKQLLS